MPRYDYRCPEGHISEAYRSRDVGEIACIGCGLPAQRVVLAAPYVTGFAYRPTREAPLPVSRFVEAQGEILHQAAKHGVEPPDLYKAAKERVARGDAVAIE